MTPDDDPITREELTKTIQNLATIGNMLVDGITAMPDSGRVWAVLRFYESLAETAEQTNPAIQGHLRAAAEALDALRSAHGEFQATVVTAAETILKEEID